MKLRIKGNSIRLRLLRSEVERFGAEGRVEDHTSFGPNTFRYSLESADVEKLHARFENGEICILIPTRMARDWTTSERVGFEVEQAVGEETLVIVVEKDFVCLDRPDDPDREDAYPNPSLECKP